jgi:hypothetical protein
MEATMKTVLVALLLAASAAASADETVVAAPPPKKDRGQFLIAVKAGGVFAEPFSRLGASYLVDLEIGYALPVLKHRLAITLEGMFTDPEANGTNTDPRLDASTGGVYSWHLEQRELILGASLVYRHPLGRWTPYVGLGPRLFLLQSKVNGTAGNAKISASTESSTKVGAGIPLGVGVRLGPGDLFLEASWNEAAIDHRATGDSNTGFLSLALGYRLVL